MNKNTSRATPKTLKEAIQNGLDDGGDVETIYLHIRDFIAQHFAVAYFKNEEYVSKFQVLFSRLVKK